MVNLEAAGIDPDGLPDLDLAFEADPELPAALLEQAAPLAELGAGSQRWHLLFSIWLAELADELPERLDASAYCLGLELVNDAAMAALNAEWRQLNGPTDVLAFAAQEAGEDGLAFPMPTDRGHADGDDADDADDADDDDGWEEPGLELGDIVISLETAARQAGEHANPLPRELLFLASHGLLHLLGWDHPDEAQLAAMLERQDQLIQAAQLAGLA
ncbi:MAG: rRNA maturation RNase YbeY [Cyanobacteriota bacterium]|nr:rRNA maturation RNase YbeY [Cyanobacteriota bacterium]